MLWLIATAGAGLCAAICLVIFFDRENLLRRLVRHAEKRSTSYLFEDGEARLGPLARGCYLLTTEGESFVPMIAGTKAIEARQMTYVVHPGSNAHLLMLEKSLPDARLFAAPATRQWQLPPGVRVARVNALLGELICGLRSRYADDCSATFRIGRQRQLLPAAPDGAAPAWTAWASCYTNLWPLRLEHATPDSPLMQDRGAGRHAATNDDARGTRTGVHVHLYFPDLWDEIAQALAALPAQSRLWVTTAHADAALHAAIRRAFPSAQIRTAENRGRDMAPFLELLASGAFDALDYVCKLHGKKSASRAGESYFGRAWRRQCFAELLGSPEQVRKVLDLFDADARIGMIGPAGMRLPNGRTEDSIGQNGRWLERLLERRGATLDETVVEFFAGGMFWFRPRALREIGALRIEADEFAEEPIRRDGTLAHALERLIPVLATRSGYRLESAPRHDDYRVERIRAARARGAA